VVRANGLASGAAKIALQSLDFGNCPFSVYLSESSSKKRNGSNGSGVCMS
jgi:hypothetical protein